MDNVHYHNSHRSVILQKKEMIRKTLYPIIIITVVVIIIRSLEEKKNYKLLVTPSSGN